MSKCVVINCADLDLIGKTAKENTRKIVDGIIEIDQIEVDPATEDYIIKCCDISMEYMLSCIKGLIEKHGVEVPPDKLYTLVSQES